MDLSSLSYFVLHLERRILTLIYIPFVHVTAVRQARQLTDSLRLNAGKDDTSTVVDHLQHIHDRRRALDRVSAAVKLVRGHYILI